MCYYLQYSATVNFLEKELSLENVWKINKHLYLMLSIPVSYVLSLTHDSQASSKINKIEVTFFSVCVEMDFP